VKVDPFDYNTRIASASRKLEALFVFGKKNRSVDTNGHKQNLANDKLEGGDWYLSDFLTKRRTRQF